MHNHWRKELCKPTTNGKNKEAGNQETFLRFDILPSRKNENEFKIFCFREINVTSFQEIIIDDLFFIEYNPVLKKNYMYNLGLDYTAYVAS